MENSVRSQRTRDAAIEAALTIISRDGPAKLTIDAITRESGISKGGVLHHFRTKEAVLRALLERQINDSEAVFDDYMAKLPHDHAEPILAAQIETYRIAATHRKSTTLAIAGVLNDAPELLSVVREKERKRLETMKAQSSDPETATLRWAAAKGLALASILEICPLSEKERADLFDRLLDYGKWAKGNTAL